MNIVVVMLVKAAYHSGLLLLRSLALRASFEATVQRHMSGGGHSPT